MPYDARLAAVSVRVRMAAENVEAASTFLRSRLVFRGRSALEQAAGNLTQAAAYAGGAYPALHDFLGKLAAFYHGEAVSVVRPALAPAVADRVVGNQGNLLSADPLLNPSAAA